MSDSKTLRYVVCPECRNKLRADGLVAHFKRAHKRDLPVAEMLELLGRMTREQSDQPYAPKVRAHQRAKLQKAAKPKKPTPKVERTPRSMRQWDWIKCDVPMRSGPLGPG